MTHCLRRRPAQLDPRPVRAGRRTLARGLGAGLVAAGWGEVLGRYRGLDEHHAFVVDDGVHHAAKPVVRVCHPFNRQARACSVDPGQTRPSNAAVPCGGAEAAPRPPARSRRVRPPARSSWVLPPMMLGCRRRLGCRGCRILRWEPTSVAAVLAGDDPTPMPDDQHGDPPTVLEHLVQLRATVAEFRRAVAEPAARLPERTENDGAGPPGP